MDVDMEDCYDDDAAAIRGGGGGGGGGFGDWTHRREGIYHGRHHPDDDRDNEDDDAMEWDAELVEAALHSLSALRRDPSLTPFDAAAVAAAAAAAAVPTHPPSTRLQRFDSLLNTPDALLSPDGAVMIAKTTTTTTTTTTAATEGGQAAATHLPLPPLSPFDAGGAPYYAVTVVPDTNVLVLSLIHI